ncbi:MAG TPA: outer membrane beta-barrel protein [bacterium]|nr:outer membrane beta-barrel protein [bacterium]
MLKKLTIALAALTALAFSSQSQAREGWSVGLQGMGNFFLTDSDPELKIGPGGGIAVDYRFNQRWSIEADLFVSFHDGTGISEGDDDMLLLGVPTVELKFYPRSQEATVEPYVFAGLGIYVLTEGDIDNDSGGVGVGGNLGAGVDFYVIDRLSLGFAVKFRPIALIQGGNNSAALIDLGLVGNVVWHF